MAQLTIGAVGKTACPVRAGVGPVSLGVPVQGLAHSPRVQRSIRCDAAGWSAGLEETVLSVPHGPAS